MIELRPISRDAANAAVKEHHSHHKPVRVHRFAVGAWVAGELVGVVVVGNPKAPALQNGVTFEVVRLCCWGDHKNTATRLLGSAWRASKAMGVRRLVSYIRTDETGTCYRAACWSPVKNVRGEAWNHGNKRERWLPGLYQPTTEIVDRVRWEIRCDAAPASATL